jgi:hypothetical protein
MPQSRSRMWGWERNRGLGRLTTMRPGSTGQPAADFLSLIAAPLAAAPAQARQAARPAPVPSTVKLAVLATAFSRDGCTPTTADLADRLDAAVVGP